MVSGDKHGESEICHDMYMWLLSEELEALSALIGDS
jgi:hypothetical protein